MPPACRKLHPNLQAALGNDERRAVPSWGCPRVAGGAGWSQRIVRNWGGFGGPGTVTCQGTPSHRVRVDAAGCGGVVLDSSGLGTGKNG